MFLVAAATMLATWPSLIITYTNAPSDHWCARPQRYANVSVEDWREMSSPLVMEGGKMVRDRCHVWKKYQEDSKGDNSDDEEGDNSALVACDKWEHDRETFVLTTIQQWDLVRPIPDVDRLGTHDAVQYIIFTASIAV